MNNPGQVLVLALLLASPAQSQENDNFDVDVFRLINSQQNPDQDGFFEYLDDTALPTFGIIPGGFFLVGAFREDKPLADVGVLSFCSQVAAFGLTVGIKWATDRPRPFQSLADVRVKHLPTASGSSFPSGHTSQAFAVATIISLNYSKPAVTIPLFLWAGLIGYGRVYLGVHYPTDIVGGMIVGVGSSLVVWGFRHRIYTVTKSLFPEESQNISYQFVDGSVPRIELLRLAVPLR